MEINPAANPVDYVFPRAAGFEHVSTRCYDVLLYTILQHFFSAVDTKLLFGVALGRQAMRVPAPHSLHSLTLHSLVTRNGVFYYT